MNLLQGELVRLTMEEPKTVSASFVKWAADSEYLRLSSTDPSRRYSEKKNVEWLEKELAPENAAGIFFFIRTLADDRLIGYLSLEEISWVNGEGWVGIGIGESDAWGQGFGTDALKVLQRYAFRELNLHRLSLNVLEYNPRAIRSYEKAGFKVEGNNRKYFRRENRRWDLIFMGILREEWEAIWGKEL